MSLSFAQIRTSQNPRGNTGFQQIIMFGLKHALVKNEDAPTGKKYEKLTTRIHSQIVRLLCQNLVSLKMNS